jgi:hypothetical protein
MRFSSLLAPLLSLLLLAASPFEKSLHPAWRILSADKMKKDFGPTAVSADAAALVGPDGAVHVFLVTGRASKAGHPQLLHLTWREGRWEREVVDDTGLAVDGSLGVARGANGLLGVAWLRNIPGLDELVFGQREADAWKIETLVSGIEQAGHGAIRASVAFDVRNEPVIVFGARAHTPAERGGGVPLQLARRVDGLWKTILLPGTGHATREHQVLAGEGLHVLLHRHWDSAIDTTDPELTVIHTLAVVEAGLQDMRVDRVTRDELVYMREENGVWFSESLAKGANAWSTTGKPILPSGGGVSGAMALDAHGDPQVVYSHADGLHLARRLEGAWKDTLLDPEKAHVMGRGAFALDSRGEPHVLFQRDLELRHGYGASWSSETLWKDFRLSGSQLLLVEDTPHVLNDVYELLLLGRLAAGKP